MKWIYSGSRWRGIGRKDIDSAETGVTNMAASRHIEETTAEHAVGTGCAASATCKVCPHHCRIGAGRLGLCGARRNEGGAVIDANYGMATALALDPIEKKPLSRFHPGSMILSYGSYGCNLSCRFCQNSDISMADASSELASGAVYISPEELAQRAAALHRSDNIGVAFTYNDPLIAPEYIRDVGALLHDSDLLSVVVTNGYCDPEVFESLLPYIDALNIDLKCFSEEGYRSLGAPDGLDTVCKNIEAAVEAGRHVEVTTLVVPGLSDDEEAFRRECEWLRSLDESTVLHISRFFPRYRMTDASPTDIALMGRFRDIAATELEHVELGNI